VLLPALSPSATSIRQATPGAYGIELTLTAPRHTYLQNALVRVTVRVRNVSQHIVRIYRDACPNGSLFAEVVTRKGQVRYPPILPGMTVPCPLPLATYALRPGQVRTQPALVILRADRLRPVAVLPTETSVRGPFVTVHRVAGGRAPRVTLSASPRLEAIVRPVAGQQGGPLYYADVGDCPSSGWVNLRWKTVKPSTTGTYVVRPPCAPVVRWSLVVGLLNQPVATVHYARPAPPTATPTPTTSEVTVTFPPAPAPVQVHVGQTLALRVPLLNAANPSAGPFWLAKADPHYLRLLTSGPSPDASRYVYRWQALASGNTIITLDPACLQHGCAVPSFALRVTITP
jgi:hypothetical protein